MARPVPRTFVLFNHDTKSVTVIGSKLALQRILAETIERAKRFVTTASGRSRSSA